MQTNNNLVERYFKNVLSSSCKCAIDLPNRITENSKTLIDHIYVNENKYSYVNGVILNDLNDPFGTFTFISLGQMVGSFLAAWAMSKSVHCC